MDPQKNNHEAEFLISAFMRVITNTNAHYDSVHYKKPQNTQWRSRPPYLFFKRLSKSF
ncbi:hypothetical protein NPX99_06610 [Bartonella sp. 220]|uniref:hypothetical protein n=1 Tax=Bartonella sp. 220B TaxID=2967260 RepID=UPI0022A90F58|nr:hypothetical protein [Bartonella sp. 220B]MCZ2158939.1 hypothetical protein [Bartonella sp. 220B]